MHGLCDNFLEVQDKKKRRFRVIIYVKVSYSHGAKYSPNGLSGESITGFLMPSLVCLGCLVLTRNHSLFTSARIFGKVPTRSKLMIEASIVQDFSEGKKKSGFCDRNPGWLLSLSIEFRTTKYFSDL